MAEDGEGAWAVLTGCSATSLAEHPAMTVMLRHIPEKALSMGSPFHFSDRE
jgi:hypothetical protein